MYIRTTTLAYDPAKRKRYYALSTSRRSQHFQRLPGFVSYAGGFDRANAAGVAVRFGQHGACCWL